MSTPAPTRPKQRVLVRWNDDLDKSLLLFITHTCTELGIKIPYDEVARRMGSTFTEGAIQQHISKLRNKMAELNVAPVPAAPKRGAVTVKPSSVYGQKGRAGPAPQQPVASKTQARATGTQSGNNTNTSPATTAKRTNRRRRATIKRSESDEGPTDDEYGGASDDDFQANTNPNGKRGRGAAADPQGAPPQKVTPFVPRPSTETARIMKALADADARYDAALTKDPSPAHQHPVAALQSAESLAPRPAATGTVSYYGQLTQAAGFNEEEEEEEEEEPTATAASDQLAVRPHNPEPYSFIQDQHVNQHLGPQSISQLPIQGRPQVSTFPQYGGFQYTTNSYPDNFQQAPRLLTASQDSEFNSNNSEFESTNYAMVPQQSYPFRPHVMSSPMLRPPYLSPTVPAMPSYNGMQQPARNNSMISNSSQNTSVYPPQTPTISTPAGINSAQQSPFNEWPRSDFNNFAAGSNQMAGTWGFDTDLDTNHPYDNALFNSAATTSIGDSFINDLFG